MFYAENYTNRSKNDFHKAVEVLDAFTKEFCMDVEKTNAENDLYFMCEKCPFEENGNCLVKIFKNRYCPDYADFGCMGDL